MVACVSGCGLCRALLKCYLDVDPVTAYLACLGLVMCRLPRGVKLLPVLRRRTACHALTPPPATSSQGPRAIRARSSALLLLLSRIKPFYIIEVAVCTISGWHRLDRRGGPGTTSVAAAARTPCSGGCMNPGFESSMLETHQQLEPRQQEEALPGVVSGPTEQRPAAADAMPSSTPQNKRPRRARQYQQQDEDEEEEEQPPSKQQQLEELGPPTPRAAKPITTSSSSYTKLVALKAQLSAHLATYSTTGNAAPGWPLLPSTPGRSYMHQRLYAGPAPALWWGALNPLSELLQKYAHQHFCWLPLCLEEALGLDRSTPNHLVTLLALVPQGPGDTPVGQAQTSTHSSHNTRRATQRRATAGIPHTHSTSASSRSSSSTADKVATTIPGIWQEAAKVQVQVALLHMMLPRVSSPVAHFSLPRMQLAQELSGLSTHHLQAMMVVSGRCWVPLLVCVCVCVCCN